MIRKAGKLRRRRGEVAAPPGGEGDLADGGAFEGVDHGGGGGEDGAVLGERAAALAEDEDVAGVGVRRARSRRGGGGRLRAASRGRWPSAQSRV